MIGHPERPPCHPERSLCHPERSEGSGLVARFNNLGRGGFFAQWARSLALLGMTATSLAAQTHLVIVSGLGGEKKYRDSFAQTALALANAAGTRFGIPDSAIIWLGEDSVSKQPHFKGQSTKANVERIIGQIAAHATPTDQLVLVLIGHGSGDGEDS